MKFFIDHQELVAVLTKLQTVTGQKNSFPLISNILVEAKGDEVTLTATDLTVSLRTSVNAKVLEPGATSLPAKKFVPLVKELTAPTLEVVTNKTHITEITANTSHFRLHGMDPAAFPTLPSLEESTPIRIEQTLLREALWRSGFAASREENRYVLSGVLLRIQNGEAIFVSTDGKMLAKTHVQIDGTAKDNQYIIPIKAVDELLKNLGTEGIVTLHLLPDTIGFETPSGLLTAKLLVGDFPDFTRLVPEKVAHLLPIHREELISLLRQISLFTVHGDQPVRFSFDNQELTLNVSTMDIGMGKVSMPVHYLGDKLDIAFNPNYFLNVLRHCEQETVALGVSDPFNPGVLIDHKEETPTYESASTDLFVLMPMRIEE